MIFEFLVGLSNLLMQNSPNRFIGGLAIFVGCLLVYGAFVIYKKKKKLIKERMIYE
jgi:riboflavin transporter FmnP